MAYAWTDGMPNASTESKLEAHFRAAIIAATTHLEKVVTDGAELPIFSWGTFSSPKNDAAKAMAADIEAAIAAVEQDPKLARATGVTRTRILTLAVRSAYNVRSGGFGEKGWAALATFFRGGKPAPAQSPAPPTP